MSPRSCVVSRIVVPRSALSRVRNAADGRLADHVEADRRLVEHEQLGVVHQRRRQVAAHPLPEAELAHRSVEERPEVQQLGQLGEPGPVRRTLDAVKMADQGQAVAQRQVPPQRGALAEHHADAPGQRRALPRRVQPRHPYAPGGRREDAGQHLDRGGLPGAVRAEVADELARRDGEGDPVDRVDEGTAPAQPPGAASYGEGLGDLVDLDHVSSPSIGSVRSPARQARAATTDSTTATSGEAKRKATGRPSGSGRSEDVQRRAPS